MKTYIYIRVSTAQQDLDAQMLGINNYLKKENITNYQTVQDTKSGATSWRDRELKNIINNCARGDLLVISELSRVGRNTSDVLNFLAEAAKKELKVYSVKNNMVFDESITSKIFSTVLALASEIERDFIRQRTAEGMANAKAKGLKMGRPVGATSKCKLEKVREPLKELYAAGVAKVAIAKFFGVSTMTVDKFIKVKGFTK